MKKFQPVLAMIMIIALSSCSTVPLTGRRQLSLVGDAEVNQSAAASYKQLLSDPKNQSGRNG
jgi:hypothetical protein